MVKLSLVRKMSIFNRFNNRRKKLAILQRKSLRICMTQKKLYDTRVQVKVSNL